VITSYVESFLMRNSGENTMGPWGSLVSLLVWDRPTAVQICAAPFAGVV
ncbi:uncharacterized protein METZ01_LOCUS364484, partial [marine metagenome]